MIMGVLTIVGSFLLSYQRSAELLNFGAFLAFMGVNLATFRQFYFLRPKGEKRYILSDIILPALGFGVCFFIWINLPTPSKIAGGVWYLIGVVYLVVRTRGFKRKPVMLDFKEE